MHISYPGISLAVVGFLLNVTAFLLLRSEKSFKKQRTLIGSISLSRAASCFVIFLWWISSLLSPEQGARGVFNVTMNAIYVFQVIIVLGLTVDRLVEIIVPLQYKAMPTAKIHWLFFLIGLIIGLVSWIVFSSTQKDNRVEACFLLGMDALSFLINTICYCLIQKKWNNRMKLALEIGALGRALQRLDEKLVKIGFLVAFCAILDASFDAAKESSIFIFPKVKHELITAAIVLFRTGLYTLQPVGCVAIGMEFHKAKFSSLNGNRVKRKRSWFDYAGNRSSWGNL